jgi:hypothetical protein
LGGLKAPRKRHKEIAPDRLDRERRAGRRQKMRSATPANSARSREDFLISGRNNDAGFSRERLSTFLAYRAAFIEIASRQRRSPKTSDDHKQNEIGELA